MLAHAFSIALHGYTYESTFQKINEQSKLNFNSLPTSMDDYRFTPYHKVEKWCKVKQNPKA